MPTIKALPKRTYGLEDVVWRISRWLFSAWPFLINVWDDFSYSESPCCLTHPIKFLLETIYGLADVVWRISRCLFSSENLLEWFLFILSLHVVWCIPIIFCSREYMGLEEVVWKNPKRLFSAWPSFVSKWNERSIYESLLSLKHPITFLLIRTYGLEEDGVWQISRLLFSSWPSWYLLYSEPPCLPGLCSRGHYGFEEEIAWRIPRWLFNAWPPLISEWNDLSNSGSPFYLSFCSRWYMVWKKRHCKKYWRQLPWWHNTMIVPAVSLQSPV